MKGLLFFTCFAITAATAQAQFTSGNLAVLRLGDGASALVNTGAGIFVDQFTPSGSLVNSLSIPSTGGSALVLSGTATAEGALSRSFGHLCRYWRWSGFNARNRRRQHNFSRVGFHPGSGAFHLRPARTRQFGRAPRSPRDSQVNGSINGKSIR